MKKYIINIRYIILFVSIGLVFNSCSDFLEQAPISTLSPDLYFSNDAQLGSYAITCYSIIPTHFSSGGPAAADAGTDNQGTLVTADLAKYTLNQYKVPTDQELGNWDFNEIYKCNYFFQQVLPKWKAGKISGTTTYIDHYIGEMYFLRAYTYFKKLQEFGDFPIIKTLLPDDQNVLVKASERAPRNEVARFILADLDSAKLLLQNVAPNDPKRNRINKVSAQLFGSRVALFEATWEKYFKGTAFVPNGNGWPGYDKEYNVNYQFPSGSIDGEIAFFLDRALSDAKAVADQVTELTNNIYSLQQTTSAPVNPYYDMFAQTDMSIYPEVLLWRQYDNGLNIVNGNNEELQTGRVNITRGMADCFLMSNGLPIYATNSGYHGDDSIPAVRQDRDNRLFLFLKEPGQLNVLYPVTSSATSTEDTVLISPIISMSTESRTRNSAMGYDLRKGINFNAATCLRGANTTGSLIFRAVEAYLNYMEACYEKNGVLDGDAQRYWKLIRNRAGVEEDYNKTIAATIMSEEAKNDWAAYSAGQLIDPTLYNIRRERRCELMAEGLRNSDLIRWRAMDQLITAPYHIEGFKLWGPVIQYKYVSSKTGKTYLKYDKGSSSNVSSPNESLYLRPYELYSKSVLYGGATWKMAHYLSPIPVRHFTLTSENGDVTSSPIYQNPNWPIKASELAQ